MRYIFITVIKDEASVREHQESSGLLTSYMGQPKLIVHGPQQTGIEGVFALPVVWESVSPFCSMLAFWNQ